MVNDVTVAWATPVNAFALGAQIEAHAESKASIHTFRLCVKYAQASGELLGRLPPEIVEIVVAHLRQPFLDRYLAEWESAERCCSAQCTASDHFDSEEVAEMRSFVFFDADSESEDEAAFEQYADGHMEHCENVENFLSMIEVETGSKRDKRFAKCAEIFAQDFHLEVYFTTFREHEGHDSRYWSGPVATVLAYLILPSIQPTMKTCPGPGTVSYLSSIIIDPSILREPSAKEKALFRETLRTLKLTPFVHEKQLTTSFPTSDRFSKASDEQPSGAVPRDRARAWMKILKTQAAELASSDWPKLMVLASGQCEADPRDY